MRAEGECHHFACQIRARVAEEGETLGAGVFFTLIFRDADEPPERPYVEQVERSASVGRAAPALTPLLEENSWFPHPGSGNSAFHHGALFFLRPFKTYSSILLCCYCRLLATAPEGTACPLQFERLKKYIYISYIFFPSVGLNINIELVCFDDRGTQNLVHCLFVNGDRGNRHRSIITLH